jgi:glycosyltransferase involved in cell wall biosynthesis
MLSWESLHSTAVGGVAAHVTELAAALNRMGHETHVFTRMAPGQRYHDWIDGVHYHRCMHPTHHELVDEANNMCRAMVERVYVVEDMVGRFDIVHAHDWLTANAMIWIKQGRGHKGIFTIHSTEYARCGNAFPNGRSQRIRDQERAGAYWADKVICVSHATRDEVMWMYESPDWKTSVVHNGVSHHRFNLDVDPAATRRHYDIGPMDPTVLFCGRLEWQKGPDILMEAIPSVLHHYGNAKFVFAGDGGMRAGIENRARQLGIWHAVRMLGYRNGNELPKLFRLSDTVCVPSRNEPFGIVVLEAWSAAKPVVVTQVGGPNEYVEHEHTGLKIAPHPESTAWGLGTIFSNFEHARWMGENGRRAVLERFGWDIIADQMLEAYGCPKPEKMPAQPAGRRKARKRRTDMMKAALL